MPEEKEPKQAKSKGRARPSFSAPVYATESRAAGWVDVPAPPDAEAVVESPSPVTAPPPVVAVTARRPRVLPKPRAAYRPEVPIQANPVPAGTLAAIEEPIEVKYDRPIVTAKPLVPQQSASFSGVIVAGVSVAVGITILSTYIAFEMFAFPLRLASGILSPRKQR